MQRVANSLEVKASFLYTPTALLISFQDGEVERTYLRRIDAGEIDIGKLVEFDEVLEQLEDGEIDLDSAREKLQRIDDQPARYPNWIVAVASAAGCGAAAVFFGAGLPESITAGVLGCITFLLIWFLRIVRVESAMMEPLAGFTVAILALIAAKWVWPLDDRLTTLAALIILIPGLTFTIAMTELASRHLASGVARMAGAATTFLTLLVGVGIAWRIGDPLRPDDAVEITKLPSWAPWVALLVAPFAFSILFQARQREWGVVFLVSWIGFISARLGNFVLGPEFGPFLGALSIGVASNIYARYLDRPAMVPLTPSLLIMVPGSLGYLSLTSFLDRRAVEGVELAFGMILVAMSLVGGLLASNAIVPPKRAL